MFVLLCLLSRKCFAHPNRPKRTTSPPSKSDLFSRFVDFFKWQYFFLSVYQSKRPKARPHDSRGFDFALPFPLPGRPGHGVAVPTIATAPVLILIGSLMMCAAGTLSPNALGGGCNLPPQHLLLLNDRTKESSSFRLVFLRKFRSFLRTLPKTPVVEPKTSFGLPLPGLGISSPLAAPPTPLGDTTVIRFTPLGPGDNRTYRDSRVGLDLVLVQASLLVPYHTLLDRLRGYRE